MGPGLDGAAMELDLSNVNPVQRTDNADAVRRHSHPNDKGRSGSNHLPDDDSKTEQDAGNGNSAEENDCYQATDEDESAILRQVNGRRTAGPGDGRSASSAIARIKRWLSRLIPVPYFQAAVSTCNRWQTL